MHEPVLQCITMFDNVLEEEEEVKEEVVIQLILRINCVRWTLNQSINATNTNATLQRP